MNSPDFSKYDADQLRQIRSRIDAGRYPERVQEIDRRLAELAQVDGAQSGAPASASDTTAAGQASAAHTGAPRSASQKPLADRASYAPAMRWLGAVWLALGLADLAHMAWQASLHGSGAGLNLGSVVVGGLLLSGSLRVAVLLRWLGWLALPSLGLLLVLQFSQPWSLVIAYLRFGTSGYLLTVGALMLQVALTVWTLRRLGAAPLTQAALLEGYRQRSMRLPLAIGAALTVGFGIFTYTLMNGDRADHALRLAQQQAPGPYQYRLHRLSVSKSNDGVFSDALVLYWNDARLGAVAVKWKD